VWWECAGKRGWAVLGVSSLEGVACGGSVLVGGGGLWWELPYTRGTTVI
jgi:hypothetical protein